MTRPAPVAAGRSNLVLVDASASSHRAVELAATMAKAFGASRTLLDVAPRDDLPVLIAGSESTRPTEDGQMLLAEEVKAARRHGVEPAVELRRGKAARQILRCAGRCGPSSS